METNRSYIGQTIQDPNKRRLEHISNSRKSNKSHHFQNAIKKYGIESFSFEVIDEALSLEELNILEEKYIKEFDSINNGFNIRNGGNNKTHNKESIKLMSISQQNAHARRKLEGRDIPWNKGKSGYKQSTHSDESKFNRSQKMINNYKNPEFKNKIIESVRKSHSTQEFKDKMTIINRNKAENCKGKTWKLIDGKRIWMEKQ